MIAIDSSPRTRWTHGYRFVRGYARAEQHGDAWLDVYRRTFGTVPFAREARECLVARNHAAHVAGLNAARPPGLLPIPAGAPRFALLTLQAAEEQIGDAR